MTRQFKIRGSSLETLQRNFVRRNAKIRHMLRSSSDSRRARRRRRIDRDEERHCRSCRRRRIGF